MKANSAFKLSRPVKCMLATMDNKTRKNDFKKLMIDAEVTYEYQKKYGSKREKIED